MSSLTPINFICRGLVNDSRGLSADIETFWTISSAMGDVERCVTRYSHSETNKNTLLYRLWNAVKALFGQSDWQRGRRALKIVGREIAVLANRFSMIPENNYNHHGDDTQLIMNVNLPVDWSSKDCDTFLRCLVKFNDNEVIRKLAPIIKKSCGYETPTIIAPILSRGELQVLIRISNQNIQESGTISDEDLKSNSEFSSLWIKEMSSTAIGKRLIQILIPS